MAGKNFLEQFSTDNKPDSFKEEVFVPSKQPKKPLNITVIIVLAVVVLLGGFLSWFFLLRPTIEVPSFIGLQTSDVNDWIKQQGIQPSGIVIKEEYSEDFASKLITYQSIEPGKKVKKDVKIDFTVSKGPDPNVTVTVPDIISMNLTQINSWIDENKLTGVKIQSEFSDEDPLDSVISFEFGSNASETNFKRSSSLTIVVSKGKQEDQPVSVPNFSGKNISEVTNWGSKNKIKIVQREDYSSTVNKDMIISQSVNPGKKITSKESLTVTISKGAPIIAPDFSSYSRENILAWGSKNNVNIEIIERYSKDVAKDKVIEQSHKNKPCNDGMSVTISLGGVSLKSFTGTTYEELCNWIDEVNLKGAGLSNNVNTNKINDDTVPVGQLFNLQLNGTSVTGNISKGRNILLKNKIIDDDTSTTKIDESEDTRKWEEVLNKTEPYVRDLCNYNAGLTCRFYYEGSSSADGKTVGAVKSIKRTDRNDLLPSDYEGTYISQTDSIDIIIYGE